MIVQEKLGFVVFGCLGEVPVEHRLSDMEDRLDPGGPKSAVHADGSREEQVARARPEERRRGPGHISDGLPQVSRCGCDGLAERRWRVQRVPPRSQGLCPT